jgi:superfamily II helicase
MATDTVVETTRVCKRCGEEKPIEKFRRSSRQKGGRQIVCGSCRTERTAEITASIDFGPARVCKRCGVEKPAEEFYRHKANRGGRAHLCPPCTTEDVREKRLAKQTEFAASGACDIRCRVCREVKPLAEFDTDVLSNTRRPTTLTD